MINIFLTMRDKQSYKVLKAFQIVLRPIVKMLLRYGIGFNSFAEAVKTVYVDVASSDFGIRGRPTNISRVAVMSGLTRKEVRRIRLKLADDGGDLEVKSTPITEVLTHWHADSDFLDSQGRPATLPFADGAKSFTSLVKKYAGDVPPGAMRTEMKRMGVIKEHDDGSMTVLRRSLHPIDGTQGLITGLVHGAYPLLSTIAKNAEFELAPGEGSPQFSTYTLAIDPNDRTRVKRICHDRLSEAAVSFDDLFAAYESAPESGQSQSERPVVMVGLYYFEETDETANFKW